MATGGHPFFGAESSGFGGGSTGPRTPLKGFGNSSTSSFFGVGQQQPSQTQTQNQNTTSGNSQFSFGGNPQQPVSSSSVNAAYTAEPNNMFQNTPRSSSFRNLRRSTSNGGGLNAGYSGHESTTPKTVRWQDAPQYQTQSQQQQPQYQSQQQNITQTQPYSNFNSSQNQSIQSSQIGGYSNYSSSPFGQTYSSSSPFQQRSNDNFGVQQQQNNTFGQSRPLEQFHNASSNFSLQPSSHSQMNTNQNSGSFSLVSQNPSSTTQSGDLTQTKSVFNSSLANLSRPLTISTSPARATVTKSTQIVNQTIPSQTISKTSNSGLKTTIDNVITPRSAIVNRIKWNLAALFLNWIIIRIKPLNVTYWYMLSLTLTIFGGDSDVQLASVLSWIRNASFIILLANLLEAFIRLQTYQDTTPTTTTSTTDSNVTNKPTARKPSLAYPPNRQVSSSSSPSINSNRISVSSSAGYKSSTPRHYAQDSPLRESINRASATAYAFNKMDSSFNGIGDDSSFSSSIGGEGWRGPSNLSNFRQSSTRKGSSSPAAAYLARKQERKISGGPSGLGEYSFSGMSGGGDFDDGTADFSQDSIDVNRAIRALSASYQREFSQGPQDSSREGVAV